MTHPNKTTQANQTPTPLTGEQVKAQFLARGEPMAQWAERNGYTRHAVYLVVNNMSRGSRGIGHEIAVKLGMKIAPSDQSPA